MTGPSKVSKFEASNFRGPAGRTAALHPKYPRRPPTATIYGHCLRIRAISPVRVLCGARKSNYTNLTAFAVKFVRVHNTFSCRCIYTPRTYILRRSNTARAINAPVLIIYICIIGSQFRTNRERAQTVFVCLPIIVTHRPNGGPSAPALARSCTMFIMIMFRNLTNPLIEL